MLNETGNSRSGRKRRRSSARLDPEPLKERSCPSLDSTIETVLRKAVRLRMDADKAHFNLLSRAKWVEDHLSKDTNPVGLKIASIQAKGGQNVETLQAKFDEIIYKAEVKMLEAPIENLLSEVKDHQEAVRTASANIDGTVAPWKVELLKNEISESKASSLVEAVESFVLRITKDIAVSRVSKALQTEINRKASKSEKMDDNEVFVPTEKSIKDIVLSEVLHAMATANPPERNRKVSVVDNKSNSKRSGKHRQSRPPNREGKRSRSKSANRSNQPRSSSKNARGKGSGT